MSTLVRKVVWNSVGYGPDPATTGSDLRRRGFTLIELLVVIGIIALLLGTLLPVMGTARKQSQKVFCLNNERQMAVALSVYLMDNDNCLPPSSCHEHDYEKYWLYLLAKHTEEPLLFRCPGDRSKLAFADWTQPLDEQLLQHPEGLRYSSYGVNNLLDAVVYDVPNNNGRFNNILSIRHPGSCIWVMETPEDWVGTDHPHPEYWFGNLDTAKKNVSWQRHIGQSNYMFIDLHVESMKIKQTYDVEGQCLWFPESAPAWPSWVLNPPF